jgi:hypothetical protein
METWLNGSISVPILNAEKLLPSSGTRRWNTLTDYNKQGTPKLKSKMRKIALRLKLWMQIPWFLLL